MPGYKSNNLFQVILELSKVRITFAVAFTTLTGYVLAKGTIDAGVIIPVTGIFLLACGASALNHLQERHYDAKMKRTQYRPLPAGKISVPGVIIVALTEITTGGLILFTGAGILPLLLGMIALFWYNVVYTKLKRITVHAVIPGSVIGAIPPLVGWVSTGASPVNLNAIVLAFFFFIWQIPHFYLLAYKYGEDYEAAGFPSLFSIYSAFQAKRIIFYWVTITAITSMFIPMIGLTKSYITLFAIGILSFRLVYQFIKPIIKPEMIYEPGKYFMKVNYYVLTIVLLLVFDRVLTNFF